MRKKLVAAGYTAPYAPRLYTLIRLVLVIGLPLLLFGLIWVDRGQSRLFQVYAVVVISALAGFISPRSSSPRRPTVGSRRLSTDFPMPST